MQKVLINIGRSNYSIACEKGQEDHLKMLGERLNSRYNNFLEAFPHASDNVLLVMTALMLEDSIDDLSSKEEAISALPTPENEAYEKEIIANVDTMVEYIEKVAKNIKLG